MHYVINYLPTVILKREKQFITKKKTKKNTDVSLKTGKVRLTNLYT